MPGRYRADSVAPGVDVEEIRSSFGDRAPAARHRVLERARLLHDLALDAEGLRRLGVVDIRIAEIAGHVAAGLELAAAVVPDAVALVVVAVVVQHDVEHRRLVARLTPQRLGSAEAETAVAHDGDHRQI